MLREPDHNPEHMASSPKHSEQNDASPGHMDTSTHQQNDASPGHMSSTHQNDASPGHMSSTHQNDASPGHMSSTHQNDASPGHMSSTHQNDASPGHMSSTHRGEQNDAPAGFLKSFKSFATDAIHVGQEPEQWTSMAVVPPISLSTTFKQYGPGKHAGFEYSRSGNPTRNCLEKAVAAVDGAKYCVALASGLAATTTITHMFKAGDGIVCMSDVYGGTNRYFRKIVGEIGLDVSFADFTQIELLQAALKPNTKMVWLETPTNPTMKVVDITACADVCHHYNQDIVVVVDNTFMSAYFQRPLALGADICMYSATKYMNGHSDVVMGLVSMNREDLYERLKFLQNAIGAVPSPFDCYLCNRGLKTLHLRMRQHFHNAMAVARFLEADHRVASVIFPGLPSHPQHELTKRQCTGCPGMITFYIKGELDNATTFLSNLKLFSLAESLGGYESLAEHPAIMTHASVQEKERAVLGISDTMIRLSVGLEDEQDIVADLDQALAAAHPKKN